MLSTEQLRSAFDQRTTWSYSVYGLRLCLPAASVLPIANNEKFGTFSFYGQLSDKLNDLPVRTTITFDSYM
jgi:hypothetical protein